MRVVETQIQQLLIPGHTFGQKICAAVRQRTGVGQPVVQAPAEFIEHVQRQLIQPPDKCLPRSEIEPASRIIQQLAEFHECPRDFNDLGF